MILTLTPNPSVDRTVFVERLQHGAVIRSDRSWSEPSGKGVNVSLALREHGHPSWAVLPIGGGVGAQLTQMLHTAQLDAVLVEITGEIRSNISLTEPDGTVTKINEAGPVLAIAEVDALVDAVANHLDGADWLACCGSLPAGAPDDLYARVCRLAHSRGVKVAVDTSGSPIRASLAGLPDLIKPNSFELAELVGRPLRTLGDVLDAAQEVRRGGAGAVLASLGPDGALLVDDDGALHGEAPVDQVVSAVGAGDAMLGGFLAGTRDRRMALTLALQWGAAAVQHEGTLSSAADVRTPVVLHESVDRGRVISDGHEVDA